MQLLILTKYCIVLRLKKYMKLFLCSIEIVLI